MSTDRSNCSSLDELERFLHGRLSEQQTEEVAAHVTGCDACQQRVAELDERSASSGGRAVPPKSIPFADESQCGRLLDQIAGGRARTKIADSGQRVERSPKRLGDYVLQQRLGEGGMGTVYRATHMTLDTPAAVKILHPHRQADLVTIGRFEREMVALGKLDHPHIVRALDAGEESGQHYLVMEYVEGIDLGRLVKSQGALPVADAAEATRQTALGLSYVHQNGRVHRDVKPSNLMLSRDGVVKLLDLGLARVEEFPIDETGEPSDDILSESTVDLTRTHQVMGTLEYMAPEQASDSRSVDHRADLYALGCTIYKLLTGRSPFASSRSISGLSQLIAHVETPAKPVINARPEVPQGLSNLIDRMLRKDQHERPQSAQEIADALLPYTRDADLAALAERGLQASEVSDADGLAATVVDSSQGVTKPYESSDSVSSRDPHLVGVLLGVAGLVLAAVLVLAAFGLPRFLGPRATLLVQAESSEVMTELAAAMPQLVGASGEFPLRAGRMELPQGEYSIESPANSPLTFTPNRLTLERNRQVVVRVGVSPIATADLESSTPSTAEIAGAGSGSSGSDPFSTIELIPLVEPQRDVRRDEWKLIDGTLVSDPDRPSMMLLPYDPPDRYRLELTATRLQNNESLHIGLAAGKEPLLLAIDSHPYTGSLSGLYQLNNSGLLPRADDVHRGQLLPLGRPIRIEITIDSSANRVSAEMRVGGKLITSWRGSKTQVNGTGAYPPPERGILFLGNWTAAIRISDLRITPLVEGGRIVEFADPTSQPARAAAEWVAWKGGIASVIRPLSESETWRQPLGGFELIRKLEGHEAPIKSLAWSHDGKVIASGSGWPSGDKTVRIWDANKGQLIHTLDFDANVMSVAFSPDDSTVLAGGESEVLTLWDVLSGEPLRSVSVQESGRVEQVAWTPDGSRIMASIGREGILRVFEANSGSPVQKLKFTHDLLAFDVSSDGERVVVGLGDGSVRTIQLDTGVPLQQLEGPTLSKDQRVYTLDLSPAGDRVIAGYKDHTTRIWDLESGQPVIDLRSPAGGLEYVRFIGDGSRAVLNGTPGIACLVDCTSGDVLGTTPKLVGQAWAAAVSPDGEHLVTAGGVAFDGGWKPNGDNSIRLWKIGTAEEATGEPFVPERELVTIEQHEDVIGESALVAIDMQGSPWFGDHDTGRLATLLELESLDLSGTAVTTAGLKTLQRLPKLERLSVAESGVSAWDPLLSKNLPVLKELDLHNTPFGNEAIEGLGQLEALERLNLSATPVRDEQLSQLASLTSLRELDLSFTAVTAQGLTELGSLPNLERINLSGTQVDQIVTLIPERFPKLRLVNVIDAAADLEAIAALENVRDDTEVLSGLRELDLIALVDPERDSSSGTFRKENGELVLAGSTRLALPIRVPLEFELTMAAEQRTTQPHDTAELEFLLPDGTRVMVGFDHWPLEGGYAIIHGIDGRMQLDSPAKRPGQIVLPENPNPSTLSVRVEGTGEMIRISLRADDEELIAWEGDRSRLAPDFHGKHADLTRPSIGVAGRVNEIGISKMTLKPLSGAVTLPDRGPSYADPDRDVAEWVINQGGFVKIHQVDRARWNLARCDSVEELPPSPFRIAEIYRLDGVHLTSDWWERVGRMKELNLLHIWAARFDNQDLSELSELESLDTVLATQSSLDDEGLATLSRLPNLQSLAIGESPLTENGLRLLANHPKLTRLRVGVGDAGEVACEVAATIPNLQRLELYQTKLTGDWARHVAASDRLARLEISNCIGLKTGDLEHLTTLDRLQELLIRDTDLTSEAMTWINQMPWLETLDISGTPVGDEGVEQLQRFRGLTELRIGGSSVTDAGINRLAEISSLQILSLSGAEGVTDASIDDLTSLRTLSELDVDGTAITPAGAERLRASLPRCNVKYDPNPAAGVVVDLRGQTIDDAALAELLQLRSPRILRLEGLGITDASIPSIAAKPSLRELAFYNTSISESGVAELKQLSALRKIEFWKMPQITDEVTKHLADMPGLEHVVFKESGFSGPGLARFHGGDLIGLNLGHSDFDGEMLRRYVLPLKKLRVLDLAGAAIDDDDIEQLTSFSELRHLHLGYNHRIKGPGLVHIKEIATLRGLLLDASAVDDEGLKELAGAHQIEKLGLRKLRVGDESIELIASLEGLKEVRLDGTEFTTDGLRRIRELMPRAKIIAGEIQSGDQNSTHQ